MSIAVTKATDIAKRVDRLIDWFLFHKPDHKHVRIFKEDYIWLKTGNTAAQVKGFAIYGDTIKYRGFELLPYEP